MRKGNEPQPEQLARVAAKIAPIVLKFCAAHLKRHQPDFHMEDLQLWVRERTRRPAPRRRSWATSLTVAPDSPGRILRLLRERRQLDYTVLSRRGSHYHLLWVRS